MASMEFQEKRSMAEMLKMPRDCARSLQLTYNIRYKGDLLKGAIFVWLADYFTTVARGKHPFPHYDLSDLRAGIYSMPNTVGIGLAVGSLSWSSTMRLSRSAIGMNLGGCS